MDKTFGIRLVLAYNSLFGWRRRAATPGGWLAHDSSDTEAAVRYAEWRNRETRQFLAKFAPIDFRDKTVLDFGCSHGGSIIHFAEQGAAKVIGVDVGEWQLRMARAYLQHANPDGRLPVEVRLGSHDHTPVADASIDLLMCMDVFEHIMNPEQVLREWCRMLKPGGRAYVSFGPLWYHPHGVHLWELFPAPWTHLLFPERTVVATRHYLKRDELDPTRVTHYRDLGFNQMTVRRFKQLLRRSGLVAEMMRILPVAGLRPLTWLPGVRELFVTEVHCVLRLA